MEQFLNHIRLVLSVTFIAAALMVPGIAIAGVDCSCRYKGQDISTGKSICIKTSKGFVMAKCDWVLNNTSWKFTDQPCPYSELNQTPVNDDVLKVLIKKVG